MSEINIELIGLKVHVTIGETIHEISYDDFGTLADLAAETQLNLTGHEQTVVEAIDIEVGDTILGMTVCDVDTRGNGSDYQVMQVKVSFDDRGGRVLMVRPGEQIIVERKIG